MKALIFILLYLIGVALFVAFVEPLNRQYRGYPTYFIVVFGIVWPIFLVVTLVLLLIQKIKN